MKLTKFLLLLLLTLSLTFANAQNCANKPIILKTFGAGTTQYNTQTPAQFGFSTQYKQENGKDGEEPDAYFDDKTQDGEFSFINSISNYWNVWHTNGTDHTGDPGGYLMMVNASYSPAEFYRDTVSGLCNGVTYELGVWLANLDNIPGRILPNVKFEILDLTNGNILAAGSTGNILASTSHAMFWERHALSFKSTTSSVILILKNNNGGGNGNDLGLDDISFTPCLPNYTIPKNDIYCLGTKATLPVSASNNLDKYTNSTYQWQKKIGNNWVDLTGQTTSSLVFDSILVSDEGWYKVYISDLGNLQSQFCRSQDSIQLKTTDTKTAPSTNPIPYCQYATATALTASGTGILQYYTVPTKGAPSASLIPSTASATSTTYYVSQIVNTCESARTPLTVTVNTIATPSVISGDDIVCANATSRTYSITNIADATAYTWNVPTSASITAGANTNSITLTFGAVSGEISVSATNGCGVGTVVKKAVSITTDCILFDAVSTEKSIDLNWTIAGIQVKSIQLMRNTSSSTVGIERIAIPAANATTFSDNTAVDNTDYWYWLKITDVNDVVYNSAVVQGKVAVMTGLDDAENDIIKIYPNPFSEEFTVKINNSCSYIIEDLQGKTITSGNTEGKTLIGNNLDKGIYILKIISENQSRTLKIVKE